MNLKCLILRNQNTKHIKVKGGERQEQILINTSNNLTYCPKDKHNHYLTTIVET